jgi:hypothetical protein
MMSVIDYLHHIFTRLRLSTFFDHTVLTLRSRPKNKQEIPKFTDSAEKSAFSLLFHQACPIELKPSSGKILFALRRTRNIDWLDSAFSL